jgi:hypothetical protein
MLSNAEGGVRQNLDRALMLVNAFGYNRPASEPESTHHEEEPFHQRLINNVIPFIMFFVKLFASLLGLAMLSILTYWFIYSAVIMRGLEVQSHPIFFDYSSGRSAAPLGRVDLHSTSHAPWVYSCDNTHSYEHSANHNFCIQDENIKSTAYNKRSVESLNNEDDEEGSQSSGKLEINSILKEGQRYFVDVVLTLPESEVNKKLGIFMLTVDLKSNDGSLLARSKQSSLFPYESELVRMTRKLMTLLPLVSGVVEETKSLSLLCFDNYMDSKKTLSYAEVSLEVPHHASYPGTIQTIQIVSAEFHYGKMMSPLQRFFRRWCYFCAFIGVFVFFIGYGVLALNIASRRGWLLNRHAYYPAFHIFGSDTDSTYNFEGGSQQNSWAGPDVEILDGADDEDEWEPLDASTTENANKSNVVPDDESVNIESSQTQNQPDIEPTAAPFPLGPLSQNPSIQSHQTMFSARNCTDENDSSAQQEEKCLADMVMKGLSKFEVFTGANARGFLCYIVLYERMYN